MKPRNCEQKPLRPKKRDKNAAAEGKETRIFTYYRAVRVRIFRDDRSLSNK
jgi:hypothetical protein